LDEERPGALSFAYLDTHIAVFLHDGLVEKFSRAAKREIEASDLLISPMVLFELEYLFKRNKIGIPAKALYNTIHADFGVTLCRFAFTKIVEKAIDVDWTNDPFDRIIVAHAIANGEAPLITKDENIGDHYPQSVW
jgi:PIN domain nuclease of toxin-antitoxin system